PGVEPPERDEAPVDGGEVASAPPPAAELVRDERVEVRGCEGRQGRVDRCTGPARGEPGAEPGQVVRLRRAQRGGAAPQVGRDQARPGRGYGRRGVASG